MQIVADLDTFSHAHILASISCPKFENLKPIRLVIDTGCTTTTILHYDIIRLGINCSTLQRSSNPSATADIEVFPYILPNVILTLLVRHGWFNLRHDFMQFHLHHVDCLPSNTTTQVTLERLQLAYSLLGMDFLKLFKRWRFTDKQLILET